MATRSPIALEVLTESLGQHCVAQLLVNDRPVATVTAATEVEAKELAIELVRAVLRRPDIP